MSENKIKLVGRVFITFDIEAVTGMHIGGTDAGVEIGGVDKTVIRDKLTNRPYIPGSSLKGKMRSLVEKYRGLKQNQRIGQGYIHSCGAEYKTKDEQKTKGKRDYEKCDVCQVFGVPGEREFATPTRLVVRDIFLSQESVEKLNNAQTDLPYTEVKTEVSIDRVTSAANPRQMERVPAGAIFGGNRRLSNGGTAPQPAEFVYSLYQIEENGQIVHKPDADIERLSVILEGMQLLEDDYLGGQGSRGSGKIRFRNIKIEFRKDPKDKRQFVAAFPNGLEELDAKTFKENVQDKISAAFGA